MALQSQLFRSDPKLEAAAVSDPAHILLGAKGDHVRKIQLALIQLDGAAIGSDGSYGPATAAAVLAYKQKRNIVNRSNQTKADNIVGKMTMAALDSEMLAKELKPILIRSIFPASRFPTPSRSGLLFAFSVGDSAPQRQAPSSAAPIIEAIVLPGAIGTMQVVGGAGGKLIRTQSGDNNRPVASLLSAKVLPDRSEEIDVVGDADMFRYQSLSCGETFFQSLVSIPRRKTAVLRLLVLVEKASPRTKPPVFPADTNLISGLVSVDGTPLNPLTGRKINLFGEGETDGFEDYSSDLNFLSHSFSLGNSATGARVGHRPWTDDPRKLPGIANKSVSNICCRGSPIKPVTVAEILRIGQSGCRVTYAEAVGRLMSDRLRTGLTRAGAVVIDEGDRKSGGRAIVFKLA